MIFLGNLLRAVGDVGSLLINAYIFLLIITAFASWFVRYPVPPFVQAVYRLTQPPLRFLRRRLPLVVSGIDLSPVVLIVLLTLIKYLLFDNMSDYGSLLLFKGRIGG